MSVRKFSYMEQASILVIATLLIRFVGFLYRVPLTNIIGDEGNGIYGKSYNIYMFFLILSSAGLPAAISKMISERVALKQYRNAHQIFKISLLISTSLGIVCALVLWFGAGWLAEYVHTPDSYYAILTLAPTILIVSVMSSFRGYFQGMKNTLPTAISQVLEQVFNAIFSVYLAFVFIETSMSYGVAGGTAGTGIGALIGLIAILLIYFLVHPVIKKKVKQDDNAYNYETDKKISKELVATAFPIILGTAIFSLTNFIDMKMVSSVLIKNGSFTISQIDALYGQLTGKYVVITTLPVSFSAALATVIIPNIAGEYKLGNRKEVNIKMNIALKYAMMFSVPAAVGIGVLADPILIFLFPNQSDGGILLKVGSVSIVFLALTQVLTGILQGIGRIYVPVISAFLGCVVKIPINYLIMQDPDINVIGAVIGTIVCYIIASTVNLYCVLKITKIKFNYKNIIIKPLSASVIMGVFCYVCYYAVYFIIPSNGAALFVSVVMSVVIYLIYMLLINGITDSDIKVLPFGDKILKLFG